MKILIVGLGAIAKKHIAALNKINSNFELYALRTSLTASIVDGITNIYSFKEIENISLDFIIISNPTSKHIKTIEALLNLNVPLFIEKPLSNILEIKNTILKIHKKKIITYMACNMRFLDCLHYVKSKIEVSHHQIQEINVYCGSYLPDWRPNIDFRKNYSAIPELGGGVHLDLIHELDYIYWFFGIPQKVNSVFKNNSLLNIQSVDYANYCIEYPNFCVSIMLNYYRKQPKRILEIIFDEDVWIIDLLNNKITNQLGEIIFESKQTVIDTYYSQLQYFINFISSQNNTSFNTIDDGYNVLKMCLNYDITE